MYTDLFCEWVSGFVAREVCDNGTPEALLSQVYTNTVYYSLK